MATLKLYRPSNGTEGETFDSKRCSDCEQRDELARLLKKAIPHIECETVEQRGLIKEIGTCLERCKEC